ncbi:MAG: hypothetical protein LBE91_03455 [Tannerella sp.]|jgi:hypothetical protein|nr:hypothetical protein [Tannerella sp.]
MDIKSTIQKTSKALVLMLALILLGSCEVDKDIKDGIPAIAQIKQSRQGNKKITYGVTEYYQVIIDAQIVTDDGRSWSVTFKEMVPIIDFPKIQPGQNVAVKYDPKDSTNICFDRNPDRAKQKF